MEIKDFKIRCSKIGAIMTDGAKITDLQSIKLAELEAKDKLTVRQQDELERLIYKRDNPQLSETTKTYCKEWLKEQIYNRKRTFSNKYTQKGIIVEDNSIDFIGDQLSLGLIFKNEQFFEDDHMHGTPDVILIEQILDAKNSWDVFTFPLFDTEVPNKDYYWQAQGYMNLVGREHYKLIYILSDTPDHLIEREARSWCFQNGYDDLDLDVYEQFRARMTYSDIPDNLKIKVFEIERNEEDIERIRQRVLQCREYIKTIIP